MSAPLEYAPAPLMVPAPKRWKVIAVWSILLADILALGSLIWFYSALWFLGSVFCSMVAILPALMLCIEFGLFNRRWVPDADRFAHKLEHPLRTSLERIPELTVIEPGGDAQFPKGILETPTATFEAIGFVHLGDFFDSSLRRSVPDLLTTCRVFRDREGRLIATVTASAKNGRSLAEVSLITEFDDGCVLMTTTSRISGAMPRPPVNEVVTVHVDMPIDEMVMRHVGRAGALTSHVRLPVQVRSLAEVLDLKERQRLRRLSWCRQHGFISAKYVHQIMTLEGYPIELQAQVLDALRLRSKQELKPT